MIYIKSPQYYKTVAALALGSFAIFANLYCVQPLLPVIAQEFNKGLLDSTLVLTIGTFGLAGSLILYGAISDAIGRYWLMLFSLIASLFVSLLMLLVNDFEEILTLRLAHGIVLGALPAVAIAYIGEEFSPHLIPGVVGIYIATNTLGGISGRLFGGFIAEYFYWKNLYWIMASINLASLSIMYLWLAPPRNFVKQQIKFTIMLKDIWKHLKHFELLAIYIVIGIAFGMFINLYSYLSFLLVKPPYNVGPGFIGLLFVTYLAGTFASVISGKLSAKIGQLNSILTGILIFMVGILFLFSGDLKVTVVGLLINAFGLFLAHSVSSGWVNMRAKNAKASASASYLVFYYLGASIAPILLFPFWNMGGWKATLVGAEIYLVVAVAVLLILINISKRNKIATSES